MRVHTKEIECVCIGMVVVERSHHKIESAVLGDEVPRLHIFVGLREGLYIYGAELVSLAVIEYAGLGCVALVAYTPGYLKAENVLFAVFVGQICRAVAPIPDELVGGVDAAPIEAAERVVLREFIDLIAPLISAAAGHAILLCGHEIAFRVILEGEDGRDILESVRDIHLKMTLDIAGLEIYGALMLLGQNIKGGLAYALYLQFDVVRNVALGR